jgi:hypothetical protein
MTHSEQVSRLNYEELTYIQEIFSRKIRGRDSFRRGLKTGIVKEDRESAIAVYKDPGTSQEKIDKVQRKYGNDVLGVRLVFRERSTVFAAGTSK